MGIILIRFAGLGHFDLVNCNLESASASIQLVQLSLVRLRRDGGVSSDVLRRMMLFILIDLP